MNKQNPGIQYLDYTWNPIKMLCTPVSAGCDNCWHRELSHRFAHGYTISEKPELNENELQAPLKLKKPSRIGVQFMGDLFHEDVSDKAILDMFIQMAQTRHIGHKYLILTKRPGRMLSLIAQWIDSRMTFHEGCTGRLPSFIHIGVSVEDQKTADERILILLQIPAAVRLVSIEPMLEGIDMKPYIQGWYAEPTHVCGGDEERCHRMCPEWEQVQAEKLDGVIVGCESGQNRRPCKIEWIENVVEQCQEAGTPVFVKQASIDGKVVKMPEILNRTWDQLP